MIYKTDLRTDNTPQALLLYGYGSYGISIDPSFSLARKSLLDRGFIYAIAHIRGGEEMGRQWYEDGKLLKSKILFQILYVVQSISFKSNIQIQIYSVQWEEVQVVY